MSRVRKAVIPAAGMGTRFLPATKSMPKEMLPIVDKPVLQYVVEEAVASGIDDVLIVTGRGKQAIENHFDYNPDLESFLREAGKEELIEQVREIGRGGGDSLHSAEGAVGAGGCDSAGAAALREGAVCGVAGGYDY